ncbi:MAG: hypothetical protein ACP5O0_09630 [Acidimicrobiales bacterium]
MSSGCGDDNAERGMCGSFCRRQSEETRSTQLDDLSVARFVGGELELSLKRELDNREWLTTE